MTFSLKRLSLEDMDQAAIVRRTSFDDRLPWLAELHTPAEDRTYFREHVFAECEVWGAIDEKILGVIAFRTGWIDQFYVLPDVQGRGIGSALLRIAQAASPSLLLWTFQRNAPARIFYETRGFAAIQETDGSTNEEHEPDILYQWQREMSR